MRPRAYARCLLLVALAATGWAQPSQQTAETQGSGSVVGHVYCADTNAPARFARVTIEPIEDFVHGLDARPLGGRIPSTTLAETRPDGSFSIEDVTPGTYYILAELAGYISPLAEFTSEEIMDPTELDEKRIRAALQQVTVVRSQASRVDFRLERGAAISGRALYDDGGAVANAPVNVLRKEKNGSWKPFSDVALSRFHERPITDDQGRYRIAPLGSGEYLVFVDLQLLNVSTTGAMLWGSNFLGGSTGAMHIYFGDTARRTNAKTISVGKGEDHTGADITVPISRLYRISGTVVAEQDGHPVNSGSIRLLDALDKSTMVESGIGYSSAQFVMEFVPEGDYVLKISSAADSILETGQTEDGHGTYSRLKPIHPYADTEQALKVSGDTAGIVVKVMEQAVEDDKSNGDEGTTGADEKEPQHTVEEHPPEY